MDTQPPQPPPDPRGRRIVILTTVASVLVMGGLVALAVSGHAGEPSAGPGSPPPPYTPAPRAFQFPPGCTPEREKPPRLEASIADAGVEFGRVKQGGTIEQVVPFQNTGSGPLCVGDPETGCGCVKVTLQDERKRYEPGERGAFVVRLLTDGHSGRQDKSFWVATNETETPRRTWTVHADISLGVLATPNNLAFAKARRGKPVTAVVRLTSPKGDAPWKVTEVSGVKVPGDEPPAYAWEAKPVEDPTQQGFDLTVTHPGRTNDGYWQAPVVVRTSHPDRPEITLNALLNVEAPILASPPSVALGYVNPGVPAQPMPVVLQPSSADVQFHVKEVRVEPPPGVTPGPDGVGFTAVLRTIEKTGTPCVDVRYDGQSRKGGLIEAVLVVTTDLADQPTLRIPIKATVAVAKAH